MQPKVTKHRTTKSAAKSASKAKAPKQDGEIPGGTKTSVLKKIQAITDGSCLGNPGPGGWACILRYGERQKEMSGGEPHTTNNRMELTAAIRALDALTEACAIEVVTDSEYVMKGITTWIHGWKKKGWLTAAKKPVVNQDLWQALDEQVNRHRAIWTWTKGHANHADNNRCDELATRAAREQSKSS